MRSNPLENLGMRASPHYISFMPEKRSSPIKRPTTESSPQSSVYMNSNQSTRQKDYLNSFKFDIQRTKSPDIPKYTLPANVSKEPTVLDRLLSGSKFRTPDILSPKPENNANVLPNCSLNNNTNNQYINSGNSHLNTLSTVNLNTLEQFSPRNDNYEIPLRNKPKIESEMFDSIMRHIDKKFGVLENRLKINEEALATVNSERLADKLAYEKKEKENEMKYDQERRKEMAKFYEILEQKEKKIQEMTLKMNEMENKLNFYDEKIHRFQNQNENKLNNVSSEVQTSLNKFLKTSKEMSSKIDLIYDSPQLVFQKITDDQEKLKKNNEESLIINQRISVLNEDLKEKFTGLYENIESLGHLVKRNNNEFGEQKLIINKIEEDFLKLLNFYKDLNEEIIKLKSFQEEIFHLKSKQSEIITILAKSKNKKNK